jgi:ribosome maturation factor RimP
MDLEGRLNELVLCHLPDDRYYLTEINAKQAGANTKICIFLDGDEGIDIGVCAQVSREVAKDLETLDLMKHPYTLMVSSPGLDRPLKLPRQYHRNLGKKLRIRLKNQKQIEGKLRGVKKEFIVVDELPTKQGKNKEKEIAFTEIETTHVLVSF